MKLNQKSISEKDVWRSKGYELPAFDREAVAVRTKADPNWIHFGAGNIFRAFPAAVLQDCLNQGVCDRGVIVAEGFDYEIISKAYKPFDDLSLLVVLKSDGTIEKRVIASVAESIAADFEDAAALSRLTEIFENPGLQMVSFTITEKGYAVHMSDGSIAGLVARDFEKNSFNAAHLMGKITALLYKRYLAGAAPIAMVSMDNCSHNGDKLREGVLCYAEHWVESGLCEKGFWDYLNDREKVSFPWSMIDKITPRPDASVKEMLEKDGFEDAETIITNKNTYTSAFVNAEETQYLVIEDWFPNGRPQLEAGGVMFADRETVDKIEKMKVCTCLNPLHTALAIYGNLLRMPTISAEMQDEQLVNLINRMGYGEGMPVVVDPGIIKPEDFIAQVLKVRLPNPFMPDTPQRIATDTSQKIPIRFFETIKAYLERGQRVDGLTYIPLVIAGYLRYLMAVADDGEPFEPSSDPLLAELQAPLAGIKLGDHVEIDTIRPILDKREVFPVDLFACGLANKILAYFNELIAAPGAVRATLVKYC